MTALANARILTMDGQLTEIERGWIALDGDRISALGAGDPPEGMGPVQDMGGDLVMPGMVNPHCHMPMTLFRGLGEDVDDRLFRYILPLERALVTADVVETGAELAALELIRGGVTTVADMYYFEDRIGAVLDRSGLRGVVGQTLADFAAPDHATMDEGFARLDALTDLYRNHPRITASAAPHAPYSTGLEVMTRIAQWSADHPGLPVGEQHRLAIGGQDRQRQPGHLRHHAIGPGPLLLRTLHHLDPRGMHLVDVHEILRPEPQRIGRPRPVDPHHVGLVG